MGSKKKRPQVKCPPGWIRNRDTNRCRKTQRAKGQQPFAEQLAINMPVSATPIIQPPLATPIIQPPLTFAETIEMQQSPLATVTLPRSPSLIIPIRHRSKNSPRKHRKSSSSVSLPATVVMRSSKSASRSNNSNNPLDFFMQKMKLDDSDEDDDASLEVIDKVENVPEKSKVYNKKKVLFADFLINQVQNKNNTTNSKWEGNQRIIQSLVNYYTKRFRSTACILTLDVAWYRYTDDGWGNFFFLNDAHFAHDVFPPHFAYRKEPRDQIDKCIEEILKCVRQKGKQIIIPILFNFRYQFNTYTSIDPRQDYLIASQTNLLLLKPEKQTLEWFAPDTDRPIRSVYDLLDRNNHIAIAYLLKKINAEEPFLQSPIHFIPQNEICPKFKLTNKNDQERLSSGYCALWSLFLMKMALKYPNRSLTKIITDIFHMYHTQDQLLHLINSVCNEFSDILLKHYNLSLNELININNQFDYKYQKQINEEILYNIENRQDNKMLRRELHKLNNTRRPLFNGTDEISESSVYSSS